MIAAGRRAVARLQRRGIGARLPARPGGAAALRRCVSPSAGTAHSTSKVCAWATAARGPDAVARHAAGGAPAAIPAGSVLASLPQPPISEPAISSPNRRAPAPSRHRSRHRGRPRRSAPPARRPDGRALRRRRRAPRPRTGAPPPGRPSCSAMQCRLSSRTRCARTRVRSPSSSRRSARTTAGTARLSTASPRNSRRSLWSAPEAAVRQRPANNSVSRKRWPMRAWVRRVVGPSGWCPRAAVTRARRPVALLLQAPLVRMSR